MIVKLQLPETSNETIPQAVVHNEDKSFIVRIPIWLAKRRLQPGEKKAYFHLTDRSLSKGAFDLGDRAPEQSW